MRPNPDARGAVLLLLLAVLALGAASLFLAAHRPSAAAPTAQTLRTLALAREALAGFALTHGRLPRPARSATDGRERPAPCVSDSACTGLLPWITLSLPGTDAWGKRLGYSVTPEFTRAPLQRTSAVANRTIQTRSGGRLVYLAGNAACSLGAPCLAAVLYSAGQHNFGRSVQGLRLANGMRGNLDEQANDRAVRDFLMRAASTDAHTPGGPFDDLVLGLAPDWLYARMARARVLP